jgi:hypothetical protein
MRTSFHTRILSSFNWWFLNSNSCVIDNRNILNLIIIHHTIPFVKTTLIILRLCRLRMIWTFTDNTVFYYAFFIRSVFIILKWYMLYIFLFIGLNFEITSTTLKVYRWSFLFLLFCTKLYFLLRCLSFYLRLLFFR